MNIDNDPFVIHIDTTTPYKQRIDFAITIQGLNTTGIIYYDTIEVTNAYEIKGILDSVMTLTPGILWVCDGGFNMQASGGFILLPGTHLIVAQGFPNDGGSFVGHGTPDSLITIQGSLSDGTADFSYTHFIQGGYNNGPGNFTNCIIQNPHLQFNNIYGNFLDCQFIGGTYGCISGIGSITRCNLKP